jgi:putative tryptophan/tyrosine transport system substrate-binding protein
MTASGGEGACCGMAPRSRPRATRAGVSRQRHRRRRAAEPDLTPYRHLLVELAEKSRLPAMHGHRDFVEAGGLMAYAGDLGEAGRRMADDVHQILNGAKPGDIPIYQATEFQFIVNLKAANALGLTIPPGLLATADEVIE